MQRSDATPKERKKEEAKQQVRNLHALPYMSKHTHTHLGIKQGDKESRVKGANKTKTKPKVYSITFHPATEKEEASWSLQPPPFPAENPRSRSGSC
jgi:hypothetical protein